MSGSLYSATLAVREGDLAYMVLARDELPRALRGFEMAREGILDNETMAAQGFPGSTSEEYRATGRITGYLREFVSVAQPSTLQDGAEVIAATVVHLFNNGDEVSRWMREKFLGDFRRFVGKDLGREQQITGAQELPCEGFSDESVALRTLQTTRLGPISSTVVDFRVGRLLGVAYVVSLGDVERKDLAREMGLELERKMVKVSLGSI